MQIGVVFPQTEIGADAGAIRAYAQAAQDLGYAHLLAYDHVVGVDRSIHTSWNAPYDVHTTFHEPFVLFGYLAAVTELELVTGIIVLPQRQTALVAKQAAEVDVLTNGRFRLGVGAGWNAVEFDALGKDFTTRGRRMDEQIEMLRRLWIDQSVTFEGDDEHVTGAGISPRPIQRPIPIWLGATSPVAYRRIGRLADGWFPRVVPGPQLDEARAIIHRSRSRADETPTRSSWNASSSGLAMPTKSPPRPRRGARRGPRMRRSQRWAQTSPPSTTTSKPSQRRPQASALCRARHADVGDGTPSAAALTGQTLVADGGLVLD